MRDQINKRVSIYEKDPPVSTANFTLDEASYLNT